MDYLNNAELLIYGNIFSENLNVISLRLKDLERKRLNHRFRLTHSKNTNNHPQKIELIWKLKIT